MSLCHGGFCSAKMSVRPSEKISAALIGMALPISINFFNDFLSNGKYDFFWKFFFLRKLEKKLWGENNFFRFFLDSPFVSPLGAC